MHAEIFLIGVQVLDFTAAGILLYTSSASSQASNERLDSPPSIHGGGYGAFRDWTLHPVSVVVLVNERQGMIPFQSQLNTGSAAFSCRVIKPRE